MFDWLKHLFRPKQVGLPKPDPSFLLRSRFWFQRQDWEKEKAAKQAKLSAIEKSRTEWKDAYYDQRDATGHNYWNGYTDGRHFAYRQTQRYTERT
jgi:hypothetical protein